MTDFNATPWRDGAIRPARRRGVALFARAVAAPLAIVAMLVLSATPGTAAEVWLAAAGSPVDLFQPDAPWPHAAAHVQVFKATTQFLSHAPDDQLRQMFADLKRRSIALAAEALIQTGTDGCGQQVEGYADGGAMERMARRVKQLGGTIDYVAMDEPLWYGHHYAGAHACRSSISAIARDIAGKVAVLRRFFPSVQVGDIEPFAVTGQPPDWRDEIAQWAAAYRAATGENLAFFHVDMDWHQTWRAQLPALVQLLHADGIKFGIIYDGDGDEPSGLAWTRHAEERFTAVEANLALVPDQAILQTWMPHPKHNLPESQPGTMTWLVNRYAAAQTRITLHQIGNRLEGQLTGPDGQALGGQPLLVEAVDTKNAGPPALRTLSGTVPAGAARAVFALRLNRECWCSGPVDVTVGPLRYRDDRSGEEARRAFSVPGTRTQDGVHIVAPSGQPFAPNTPPWPVTPGDRFTIQVTVGAAGDSLHSGFVALIFLPRTGPEILRTTVRLESAIQTLGEVTTGADGRFSLPLNASVLRLAPGFRVEFAGADTYRPGVASLP